MQSEFYGLVCSNMKTVRVQGDRIFRGPRGIVVSIITVAVGSCGVGGGDTRATEARGKGLGALHIYIYLRHFFTLVYFNLFHTISWLLL